MTDNRAPEQDPDEPWDTNEPEPHGYDEDAGPDEQLEDPTALVLAQLAAQLHAAADRIVAIEEYLADPPGGGPWCWRYLDRDAKRVLAEELRDWVDWLIQRYSLTNIPSCWYRHGRYVEELTALYVAWRAAYNPKTVRATDGPIAWHDRWLTPCMTRLAAPSCNDKTGHRGDTTPSSITNLPDFTAWLDEQDDDTPPDLSAEDMEELVASENIVALTDDPASPVLWRNQWWGRKQETPRRLSPGWSAQDWYASRRLNQLQVQRDQDTSDTTQTSTSPWLRAATLAARGLRIFTEPRPTGDSK